MALSKLSGDQHRSIFGNLCNVLDPRIAVALSGVSHELREPTQGLLQQLRADHEAAAALCQNVGTRSCKLSCKRSCKGHMWSCKELREATEVEWYYKALSGTDLATLGTLGSVLPALKELRLASTGGTDLVGLDGVQRLAAGLSAGALPAVTFLEMINMHVGDAGASEIAAALLGRGALPRLENLRLYNAAIGDAGLVALAPALRRLPAMEILDLGRNSLGDEGLAALIAPPPPPPGSFEASAAFAGPRPGFAFKRGAHGVGYYEDAASSSSAPKPLPTWGLTKLHELDLSGTQITDACRAALLDALDSGALPALKKFEHMAYGFTLHAMPMPGTQL